MGFAALSEKRTPKVRGNIQWDNSVKTFCFSVRFEILGSHRIFIPIFFNLLF